MAQASKRKGQASGDGSSGALVCQPEEIFDYSAVIATLDAALGAAKDGEDKKTLASATLGPVLAAAHERLAEAVRDDPCNARAIIRSYTYLAECTVRATIATVIAHVHPVAVPTEAERLSVLFVGGSGRAEMAPGSDLDVLFLTPYKQTAWGESVVESALYVLWDLKLKVGYAVRTVADCLRLAKEDITIRTNLLESRFLMGDGELAETLKDRLWTELFAKTGAEFVEAKLQERDDRHKRHGQSRYMVEPNIKEGKGGLRDLQTLYWIAKYLYHVESPRELVGEGVFTEEEYAAFDAAEMFLWSVRCLMHLAAGRAVEQLTFDLQVEVAAALGYRDEKGMRGVEQFMQTYFRHARHVGELTRVFLVDLENKHVKSQPNIGSRIRSAFTWSREKLAPGFENQNGRLAVSEPDVFLKDPLNILRLFCEALSAELMLHPDAMRLVASNLDIIDDKMRGNAEANELFLSLLLGNANPQRALRRMNDLGVLGAFIPEFGRIVALMQFNMYHLYTVDEHIIACVSILSEIERQELVEDLPVASEILAAGVNRRVLYVALLLHDIGKGLPQDHSEIGAEIAEVICPRLGLPEEETEAIVWLVRHHLLMSDVAQKRDISDPRTVRGFAQQVRTVTNLKLLTVLTVCDIRGVGPDRWNNWKAVLIRELYAQTMEQIRDDGSTKSSQERIDAAKAALAKTLAKKLTAKEVETELARHYPPFWIGFDQKTQVILSKLSRAVTGGEILSDIQMDKSRDATRAAFAMGDHPGIFSRLTGALALAGANVVDARTNTTADGVATSVFWLQDAAGQPYEKSRLGRLRKSIDRTLGGEIVAREALRERDVEKRREQQFIVPTTISFDNDGSEISTIIEVDTRDRPGLLHDLSRALANANLSISSAIIATYGKQAVDTFYVKDLFGMKIRSEDKQAAISNALKLAITKGLSDADELAK